MTHISNEMVENEEPLELVLPRFRKYIGDRTIIAHNAKFDLKFLNYYLRMLDLEPINNYICTVELLKNVKVIKEKIRNLKQLVLITT